MENVKKRSRWVVLVVVLAADVEAHLPLLLLQSRVLPVLLPRNPLPAQPRQLARMVRIRSRAVGLDPGPLVSAAEVLPSVRRIGSRFRPDRI